MTDPTNSTFIDHARALRLTLALAEQDGTAFTETMREISDDDQDGSVSGVLFAAITLSASVARAAWPDQFRDTLRAGILTFTLRDAERPSTD